MKSTITALLRSAAGRGRAALLGLWPAHIPIAVKLAVVMTTLLVFGMAALGLFIADNQNRMIREQLHDFGNTMVRQLAKQASEPILSEDGIALRLLTGNLGFDEKIMGAGIYSHDGRLLSAAGIQPARSLDILQQPGLGRQTWFWNSPAGGTERLISFIAPALYQDLPVGSAVVTLSASLMDEAAARARRAIVYAIVAMSVLASLLAYALSRRLSLPIHNLMEATRAIDRGDLAVRIHDRRNDEIGFLIDGFNNMAAGLLRKSQVEQVFSRYVSKNVADKVLANLDEIRLGSRHVEATVLFADIVGFTAMSEKLQPREVSELLNEYFSHISHACSLYGGVVDKFIGDCAMLVFGAVEDDHDHSFHAVSCSLLIQRLAAHLNAVRRSRGAPEVQFRIGVNCGTMLAGNLGSDERMEYTVVGDAVNLASRLCYAAEPGQIIMREELVRSLQTGGRIRAQSEQTIAIRGKSEPVEIYSLLDVHAKFHPLLNANLEEVLNYRGRSQAAWVENA